MPSRAEWEALDADPVAIGALVEQMDANDIAKMRETYTSLSEISQLLFGSGDVEKHGVEAAVFAGHDAVWARRYIVFMRHLGWLGATA